MIKELKILIGQTADKYINEKLGNAPPNFFNKIRIVDFNNLFKV